jgi:putative transposase
MARQPRLSIAGQPHYVLLCGHNQQAVWLDAEDRQRLFELITQCALEHGIEVYAWSLMPEQVQLLLNPLHEKALPAYMQAVGRRYVQAFNRKHGRTGTLWDGRYRSTVLQPNPWVLRAMVWLDASAWMSGTQAHGEMPSPAWFLAQGTLTSAAHHLGLQPVRSVGNPPQWWALGNTPFAREAAYDKLLEAGVSLHDQQTMQQAAMKGWALGDADFLQHLQLQTHRRLAPAKAGRPKRVAAVVAAAGADHQSS